MDALDLLALEQAAKMLRGVVADAEYMAELRARFDSIELSPGTPFAAGDLAVDLVHRTADRLESIRARFARGCGCPVPPSESV